MSMIFTVQIYHRWPDAAPPAEIFDREVLRGGHLKEAVVSVTCGINLTRFRDEIARKQDAA